MKTALWSSFDPLPHALSTKGLCALVAIVILGTGITVQRYLEGSQAANPHPANAFDRPGEVWAAPGEGGSPGAYAQTVPWKEARSKACRSWHAPAAVEVCPRPRSTSAETTSTEASTSPSMFRPSDESVGG
jgi:hypothetical protein